MTTSCEEQVDRYIRTGRHEHFYPAWPGSDFLARAQNGHAALRAALVAEVRSRAGHATIPAALAGLDLDAFTRARVAPMGRGLFPRAEQAGSLMSSAAPSSSSRRRTSREFCGRPTGTILRGVSRISTSPA